MALQDTSKLSRRQFLSAAAGASASTLVYYALGANDAEAGQIFIKDLRDTSKSAIDSIAARISSQKNGIILTVFGNDEAFEKKIITAAGRGINTGYPILAVIMGDKKHAAESEIYAAGQRHATIKNDGSNTLELAEQSLAIVSNRLQANLSTPSADKG